MEVTTRDGKTERNEPLPEQLDRTPDAKGDVNYCREIQSDELKHLDWRRKLACMLVEKLGNEEQRGLFGFIHSLARSGLSSAGKPYILHSFPENYRLFEHVIIKSKTLDADGKPQKNSKTHASGGHDRTDAYIYGHPLGRKKRYRSPTEFFPHLLWLCTDQTNDPQNCSCKHCSPDEIQPEEKPGTVKKQSVTVKKEKFSVSSQPVSQVASNQVGTPLPHPRSVDQQVDAQYGRFLCRPGEVVWFERGNGAWGLGVIVRRWIPNDVAKSSSASKFPQNYMIQPLSHPFNTLSQDVITSEYALRPWLVWSPPPYCHTKLNNMRDLTYDTADWNDIQRGAFGDSTSMSMVIDGSILAARAVDRTCTPFELLKGRVEEGISVRHYNGLYLGGEKLWLGDPAILSGNNCEDVIVITDIIERTPVSQPPTPFSGIPPRTTLTIVGDVYTPRYQSAQEYQNIPLRMREDLQLRNSVLQSYNPKSSRLHWHLLRTNQTLDVDMLRGRWYESSIILPLIEGPRYNQLKVEEKIASVGRKLNARLPARDNKVVSRYNSSRIEALGKSVPQGLTISDGIVPPPKSVMPTNSKDPQPQTAPTMVSEKPIVTDQVQPQDGGRQAPQHPDSDSNHMVSQAPNPQGFQEQIPEQPMDDTKHLTDQAGNDGITTQQLTHSGHMNVDVPGLGFGADDGNMFDLDELLHNTGHDELSGFGQDYSSQDTFFQ